VPSQSTLILSDLDYDAFAIFALRWRQTLANSNILKRRACSLWSRERTGKLTSLN
jgi:hypothetical protein